MSVVAGPISLSLTEDDEDDGAARRKKDMLEMPECASVQYRD